MSLLMCWKRYFFFPLQPPHLTNCVLLRELRLDDNSISSLDSLSTAWLPLLQLLSVSQNRFVQPLLQLLSVSQNRFVQPLLQLLSVSQNRFVQPNF